jgi:hypothetical protein
MKKIGFLLKLAAVASSLVLIGGFVAYSAGAFDWLMNRAAPAADSDDESLATTTVDPWLKPAPRTYMGGSKYGVIVNVPKTVLLEPPEPPSTLHPSIKEWLKRPE